MLSKIDKNNELRKILLRKYSAKVISNKELAHELFLVVKTLRNYDLDDFDKEISSEEIQYSIYSFISFIKEHSYKVKDTSQGVDKSIFYEILDWLYLKFDRIMISKGEYLGLVKDIKIDRLNDRIQKGIDIPTFFKYRTFRFNIVEVAYYLATNNYMPVTRSAVKSVINIDTIRVYIENYPSHLILEYFKGNGCSYYETERGYEVFYKQENYTNPPRFRITSVHPSNANAGCSIELYGLKTYNEDKDKDRAYQYNTLLEVVKDMNLDKRTYITKLDIAYDFPIYKDNINVLNHKDKIQLNNIIKDHEYDLRYYEGKTYHLKKIQKYDSGVTTISLEKLHHEVMQRFEMSTPKLFEVKWFKDLKKDDKLPSLHAVNLRWLEYQYDILLKDENIKIKYKYQQGFNECYSRNNKDIIIGLKSYKPENRVNIYDKADKEKLAEVMTRVEFTFTFKEENKIPFSEFENTKQLNTILAQELEHYNLFVENKIFDFTAISL